MTDRSIPLRRPKTEGGGCYGCKHFRVCSLRHAFDREILGAHTHFFDVDEKVAAPGLSHMPRWSWIPLVIAEACTKYEPEPSP